MGFGHRVYKSYDPRAKVIKRIADLVFTVTGKNPLLEIALELERIALQDDYFVTRKLYPNVDFYSGLIYQAMGFPVEMFPVLFAIPRTAGWIAQWEEMLLDPEQKIARPRQIYTGAAAARLHPARQATMNWKLGNLVIAAIGLATCRASLTGHRSAVLTNHPIADSMFRAFSSGLLVRRQVPLRLQPRLGAPAPARRARAAAGRIAGDRADAQVHQGPARGGRRRRSPSRRGTIRRPPAASTW